VLIILENVENEIHGPHVRRDLAAHMGVVSWVHHVHCESVFHFHLRGAKSKQLTNLGGLNQLSVFNRPG